MPLSGGSCDLFRYRRGRDATLSARDARSPVHHHSGHRFGRVGCGRCASRLRPGHRWRVDPMRRAGSRPDPVSSPTRRKGNDRQRPLKCGESRFAGTVTRSDVVHFVGVMQGCACTGDSLNQRTVLDTVGEALLLIPVAVKATMQK
jgi:hypothetical protein